jgi:hypothetical protein
MGFLKFLLLLGQGSWKREGWSGIYFFIQFFKNVCKRIVTFLSISKGVGEGIGVEQSQLIPTEFIYFCFVCQVGR